MTASSSGAECRAGHSSCGNLEEIIGGPVRSDYAGTIEKLATLTTRILHQVTATWRRAVAITAFQRCGVHS
jgi:hypothetical protein